MAEVQSWVQASGLARFDGHAMRLNSQAAMEDLSVSERFRAIKLDSCSPFLSHVNIARLSFKMKNVAMK